MAYLENGCGGLATASGMAAITTVYLTFLDKNSHLISTAAVYGPSRTVLENEFLRFGVEVDFVDTSDIRNIEKHLRPSTKLLFIETPVKSNISG